MKIKNRHYLKAKDVKIFQKSLQNSYPNAKSLFKKENRVETGVLEDGTNLYFINGELSFFEKDDHLVLFLRILLKELIQIPKVVVDMGAIPFIVKGADVMVPGIVSTEGEIKKDDYVVIIDVKHEKPLAVGIALLDAFEISNADKGKAIKNLHYIGDRYWDAFSKQ